MSNAAIQVMPGGGGSSWRVTGATQTVAPAANGQYARGWEVAYQLDSGHGGTVFLTNAEFNPDMVRSRVQAAADQLNQVVNLSS